MNNQNNQNQADPQAEAEKLNAIANIIAAGGGAVGTIGGLFGKGPQTQPYNPPADNYTKTDDNKKKQNQLLIYGGIAVVVIVILLMFKKK